MREIQVSDTCEELGRQISAIDSQPLQKKKKYPLNMCFHIVTSIPDLVLICCRAKTRPVIDLDLFYAAVRPHAKTERLPKRPVTGQIQGCRRGKCEYIVGGSSKGTLQQLV